MRELYIHVGLPKTGTTFLQEEIFKKMKNIRYIRDLDITSYVLDDRKTIISHENLAGVSNPSPASHRFIIADYLHKLFPDAKIIVGIRDKDSWLYSLYSQHIRNGGSLSFEEFLAKFDKRCLDFEEYISYLKSLFSEVYVYRFEDLIRNKAEFVKKLCDFIGEPVPRYKDKKRRVSLKSYQLKTIRFINKTITNDLVKRVVLYVINRVSNSQPQGREKGV